MGPDDVNVNDLDPERLGELADRLEEYASAIRRGDRAADPDAVDEVVQLLRDLADDAEPIEARESRARADRLLGTRSLTTSARGTQRDREALREAKARGMAKAWARQLLG
jgi:hypothetical protein